MSSVDLYLETLHTVASNHMDDWNHESWNSIPPLITQEVLDYSYDQVSNVKSKFINYFLTSRTQKLMSRITEKIEEQSGRYAGSFKVICDLIAFRIKINKIQEIQKAIDYFIQRCQYIFVRDPGTQDIVKYVYVYLENIGMVEIQIGHPFAIYTFTVDSQLRDDPSLDLVDLWQNDFYVNTKKKILDPSFDYDVMSNLQNLYDNKTIPQQLLDIISVI